MLDSFVRPTEDEIYLAKMDYVMKGLPITKIAEKHVIDATTLNKIATMEDWKAERVAFLREVYDETREATKRSLIEIYKNTVTAAHKMSAWAANAIKVEDGEIVLPADGPHAILRTITVTQGFLGYAMGDLGTFSQGDESTTKTEDDMILDYEEALQRRKDRRLKGETKVAKGDE